ncbi:UDP-N-acetylglucosamine 1-carboxyvinyltransferase [candidate division KSB1 bacterium]
MEKFVIKGGTHLEGSVRISGAKNAVLPLMAAALLSEGKSVVENVPDLRDVRTMCHLLRILGAQVHFENETITIDTERVNFFEAPYDLVKTMRASVYVLGPLTARYGHARVSLPGGCAWGPRPIDMHLSGLEQLGASLELDRGYINARASRLKGAEISFPKVSVGATGNILMAAVLADGETVLNNVSIEPEITALAASLNTMGAHIEGIGERTLRIKGVTSLSPLSTSVIPDRIEASTFLTAGAIAGGKVSLVNAEPEHIRSITAALENAGVTISTGETITLESSGRIRPVDIRTAVYPGFPTDMQAQWIALMSIAGGDSVVEDTIFFDRFTHVAELNRLGANITIDMNRALVKGTEKLYGAQVMSTDLRASASLIIAGLRAQGQTIVDRIYHIDRGYDSIEEKLRGLGADILRADTS